MDIINGLDKSANALVVSTEKNIPNYQKLVDDNTSWKLINADDLKGIEAKSVDAIVSDLPDDAYIKSLLDNLLSALKAGGKLILGNASDAAKLEFELKINGFTNVTSEGAKITAVKPSYEVGSSSKLNLKKNTAAVWKLNTDDDDDDDIINQDNLLDEEDLKNPEEASLRVCGTTGKRKACKDCSCGLAEELDAEKIATEQPKSSCGSCYLGDAFRCASCPYLGMPAFKPGEKIELKGNQLQADV